MGESKRRAVEIKALKASHAMHEAGHAVVAYFLRRLGSGGMQIFSPDGDVLATSSVSGDGTAVDTIAIGLAGPMAEIRSVSGIACNKSLAKPTAEFGWISDANLVAKTLGLDLANTMPAFCKTVRHEIADNPILDEALEKASAIITDHWQAIEAVGQALLSNGALSPDEVRALIESCDPVGTI